MSPSDEQNWRHILRASGTTANTIARRLFIIAGFMTLTGAILSIITMLLGLEEAEWAFVLTFWIGIMLSAPALAAMLLTGRKRSDMGKVTD